MNELTQRGIAALKAGDRAAARQLLGAAVRQAPEDILAWLWLSGAVESDEERVKILRHVQRLDPGNQAAARGLSQVLARRAQAQPQPAGQEQPEEQAQVLPAREESLEAPAAIEPADQQDPADQQEPAAHDEPAALELLATPAEASDSSLTGAVQSVPAVSAEPATAPTLAAARRRKKEAAGLEQVIFRTRPSLVQALLTFWLFFFGALAVGFLLLDVPGLSQETGFLFSVILGFVFQLVVLSVVVRRLRTRYELTGQQLTLPFRGKRVSVPVEHIFGAECRQDFLQKILSIGDVSIDAVVAGELAHLSLRDVPDCKKRAEQIAELVQIQDT